MIIKEDKNQLRKLRHFRVRNKVSGTAERPRLNVYRSTTHIYAQIIDDTRGVTLASASTVEKALADKLNGKTKKEQAQIIGNIIAERAIDKGIKTVVFDRGGYLYTGRVKELAEGARSSGLVL